MKKEINWKTVATSLGCLAFMALVIFRPSFDARVAVEKKVGTAEGFTVTEVIGEKAVDQNRLLFLYLGEKGEIDCAAVKKNFGLYRAEAVFGYLPAREAGPVESGGSRAHLLYCPYRQQGEWYLCYGVITDQDVANVSFGEQEMEELQYGGVRIVYCWGKGDPDADFSLRDAQGRELSLVKE